MNLLLILCTNIWEKAIKPKKKKKDFKEILSEEAMEKKDGKLHKVPEQIGLYGSKANFKSFYQAISQF